MFYEIANFCEKSPFFNECAIFFQKMANVEKIANILLNHKSLRENASYANFRENASFLGGIHYYNIYIFFLIILQNIIFPPISYFLPFPCLLWLCKI